ncbi:MAG TPA: PQQ-dependent sugar dehydrogenase [Vicinamibacterales bacterium]|nr:PQQ-dependent sugar dehydrogenase [Vicinamibacterales bacterium]
MIRRSLLAGAACVALGAVIITAQTKSVPRPAALPPGQQPPGESAAPDGYAPIPQWLGQTRAPVPAKSETFAVETFADGLNGAGSFHFLPDGRILVAERPGRLKIVGKDGKISEPLEDMPKNMYLRGQALYEVQPDKNFSTNRTIYMTYAILPEGADPAKQRSPGHLHVVSAKISADDKRLENVKDLLDAEGVSGHVVQANDGTLLVTSTVPAGLGVNSSEWMQPQQLDSLMGKILRINADGSIPKDNPFVGKAGARPEIFALGFRDEGGVAINPKTGRLWAAEHGPRGGDELNEVEKGKNYGFPVISYGRDYTGKPINNDKTTQAGMEQPVYFWTPDIAPGGIGFYTGKMFPAWDGNLFVSGLVTKCLIRLVLNGNRVIGEEHLLVDQNVRIRAVNEGPDGALYVMTDGMGGKILRLKKG